MMQNKDNVIISFNAKQNSFPLPAKNIFSLPLIAQIYCNPEFRLMYNKILVSQLIPHVESRLLIAPFKHQVLCNIT